MPLIQIWSWEDTSSLGPHLLLEASIRTMDERFCSLPACPGLAIAAIPSLAFQPTSSDSHMYQSPAEAPSLVGLSNYKILGLPIHIAIVGLVIL